MLNFTILWGCYRLVSPSPYLQQIKRNNQFEIVTCMKWNERVIFKALK